MCAQGPASCTDMTVSAAFLSEAAHISGTSYFILCPFASAASKGVVLGKVAICAGVTASSACPLLVHVSLLLSRNICGIEPHGVIEWSAGARALRVTVRDRMMQVRRSYMFSQDGEQY